MNVIELVERQLKQMGADGLYDGCECGCIVGGLAPCGQIGHECVAAYNDKDSATSNRADYWMMPLPEAK